MIRIGLIGGIASGKSTVARWLGEHGAAVIDADRLAHAAYAPGSAGFEGLLQTIGGQILAADGSIDRQRLAEIVFSDPAQMQRLTGIVWPLTRGLVVEAMARAEAAGARVCVLEAPRLLEAGWRDLVDAVWLVSARAETQMRRLEARGLAPEQARLRLAGQTESVWREAADLVIGNDGSLAELNSVLEAAWASFDTAAR